MFKEYSNKSLKGYQDSKVESPIDFQLNVYRHFLLKARQSNSKKDRQTNLRTENENEWQQTMSIKTWTLKAQGKNLKLLEEKK